MKTSSTPRSGGAPRKGVAARRVVAPRLLAARAVAPRTEQLVPARTLTRWNAALAVMHAGLAAVTLAAGKRDLQVPVYKTVLRFVERAPPGVGWDLFPDYRRDGSLPFTALVAVFFGVSSVAHLLNATLLRDVYLRELARCRTPLRWIEYFFSAGVMMLLIAYTLGIRERWLLLTLAALVSTTMPFGYWVEVVARPASQRAWATPLRQRLLPWALGNVPQAVAWTVVVAQFYTGAATAADRAPAFVHAILWTELALFVSFGFVSLWTQLAPPRRFYQGEIAFQVLSLASKGLLGGILLANVLMLSRFEDVYDA